MNLQELVNKYIEQGYNSIDAQSKVNQDIILYKINKSNFNKYITIKGGVVLHNISKDKRRATRDLDMDFIKYSLGNESIEEFINKLNLVDDGVNIIITGKIEELHHQDYNGKRVNIEISDNYGNRFATKLDLGVQKNYDIKQEEYYFDLNVLGENINLLINSKEQILIEKLKSLLKFGIRSTRYKDIFDFYYLISSGIDKDRLLRYMNIIIFEDENTREKNITDVIKRLNNVVDNKNYLTMISRAENNWLEIPVNEVIEYVLSYFNSLI